MQAIAAGHAAWKSGNYALARRQLESIAHPQAIHLLALIEKDAGNLQAARSLLERAAAASPNDAEIANNQGNVARLLGDDAAAETAYRRALELVPNFVQAGIGFGRLLIDRKRWEEADRMYARLSELAPERLPVRYGAATVALELGRAEEAESVFAQLIAEGSDRPEIRFMHGRALAQLRRTDDALVELAAAYRAAPSPMSLRTLASTLWMQRERERFDELLTDAAGREPALAVTAAEIQRESGAPESALATIGSAERRWRLPPEADSVAAMAYIDLDDAARAEQAARSCLAADPGNRTAKAHLITALLMQGHAGEALEHVAEMRAAEPDGQHWIAYEATALRLLGSEDYRALVDLDRFVQSYTLPTPSGYDHLADFNRALLEALDRWHLYETHPLDQSLRGGSQTPRDLTSIDDPVIRAFIQAIDEPIRRYMAAVGTGVEHPLTRRNTGDYRIAGCWSVKLSGRGYHVNHVHPEGWISSAYYVAVPEETRTGDDRSGWIKFGEPPFATVPATPPEKWIRPEAGLLVLFPSFLWHGTAPIHDRSLRVTAPFDAVPI